MKINEVGGFGKTTMAKNIAKQLIEKYNFLVKVLNANNIEDKFGKILREDCCYLDDKFKDKYFDLIDSINNELNIILNKKKELKVLFLIDNIKKNFDEKRIYKFIEKLVNIEKITPLRLELAAKFISKSIKEFQETNKIMENFKTGVSDMEFTEIILKSLEKDDQTIKFLHFISFMDNSFISLDTIKLITNSDNITEILDKLDENGIIKKTRKNDNPGIQIHDSILNVIENNLKINYEIK
ncbi:hypothetical protein BpHYR1_052520 [Brachionus plicatilis]|uniref:NB-ARC domain-containing protein n=1 Tax=Brachionus plicatilis TaxID=10195 RepID=A0A3M7QT17_BRAPC|nr:hypothetical protein BpHYR1_052520 [Brachionus plicatilis]